MTIELFTSNLLQGSILALLALGIMIPFKLLNFPDLSIEGSYPLGGALCAALIIQGCPPLIALIIATIAGGLIGLGTAFIHLRYKVNTLLAGIILSTMIYSINLRIMGKANLAIFNFPNLFPSLARGIYWHNLILCMMLTAILSLLYLFLKTEKGLRFRAVGFNPHFAARYGTNPNSYVYLGLFIGNAIAGLAGASLVQIQNYADINIGTGIIVHALAALMIGEKILGSKSLCRIITAPVIGALIYQQIQGLVLTFGLEPGDLKLLTGIIVLIVIALR